MQNYFQPDPETVTTRNCFDPSTQKTPPRPHDYKTWLNQAARSTTTTPRTQRNGQRTARAGKLDTTTTSTASSSAISVNYPDDQRKAKGAQEQSGTTTKYVGGGRKDDKEDGGLLDALSMLGDVDSEQRGRLARAQGILEAELARCCMVCCAWSGGDNPNKYISSMWF